MGTRKNALVTLLAAILTLAGCASSADTPDEDGDGMADGDDDGGDGDGDDGDDGMADGDDDGDPVMVEKENVIDDLEDNDDAILDRGKRTGSWYTFNDETMGGTQTPGTSFKPTAGGADGSKYAAVTAGKGFKTWGAGMGFDLNYDGSPLMGKPKPVYDGSAFKGITFKMKSKTAAVRFMVSTQEVLNSMEGGTCMQGTTDATMCDNSHGVDLKPTKEWKTYTVPFADLKQGAGWGKVVKFDAKKLIGLQFMVPQNVDFEISVDDVAFY